MLAVTDYFTKWIKAKAFKRLARLPRSRKHSRKKHEPTSGSADLDGGSSIAQEGSN